MFTLVGLLEFFYKEAPAGMKSLSTSFTWVTLSLGYFLSTIFVTLINAVTKRVAPSKRGWIEGDLNTNNLHLFYWFLALLSCLNFLLYLWSAWCYKYKSEEQITTLVSNGNVGGENATPTASGVPMLETTGTSSENDGNKEKN